MDNSFYRWLVRNHLLPTVALFILLAALGVYLYFYTDYPVSWPGFISMMLFYGFIFFLGTYAGSKKGEGTAIDMMLAGRNLPLGIAVFSMSATWVGGGYINGTAEYTASPDFGLVWVQAPWGYALSLIFGGLFFAGKMRRHRFQTMLDPLAQRFGRRMAAIQFLPALTGELFWSGAILTALGTTFGTVLGLDTNTAIVVSAAIAVAYTALGGLWSVAVTDVVQLSILLIGLLLVVPDALEEVGGVSEAWASYKAQRGASATLLPSREALGDYYWYWWDYALLLICGGIPWQVYFQRVLASKDEKTARRLSYFAGGICLVAAIPPILIGIGGSLTDWDALGLPAPPDSASILPHVVRYLTHPWVATVALGAVAAAVMSSVDSSILSAASLATWNVYRPLVRPQADSRHLAKVIKRCIWIIGVAATLLALRVKSIYMLWALCSDFVYCLLFPALVAALFDKRANAWGAAAGFAVAFVLRFGGGEPALGLPAILPYPMMVDGVVLFPFRTFSMLCGLISIFAVSRLTSRWSAPVPLQVIAEE
ncbi:MAG: sodium:solute symporter family protein [Saprospirales bacterium]|nr:sodium:solute symporter family protein [Saprospirales bacterium]MBK8490329.1 sodium:solute symporter family protein [Saprospirales bacterium]